MKRCFFGRNHHWLTSWFDQQGNRVSDQYKCSVCGTCRDRKAKMGVGND